MLIQKRLDWKQLVVPTLSFLMSCLCSAKVIDCCFDASSSDVSVCENSCEFCCQLCNKDVTGRKLKLPKRFADIELLFIRPLWLWLSVKSEKADSRGSFLSTKA